MKTNKNNLIQPADLKPPFNYTPFIYQHVDQHGKPVGKITGFFRSLWDPIDAIFFVIFRILWGSVLTYEAWTYVASGGVKTLVAYYVPRVIFPYYGFEWLTLLPFPTTLALAWIMTAAGAMVTVGFLYQPALLVYHLIFSYLYFLNSTEYLNHFYLLIVINSILLFFPLNCKWSIDALLRPTIYRDVIPRWPLLLLLAELSIVYTYAGIVKINPDWLRAEPLIHWLQKRSSFFNNAFEILNQEFMAYFFSYGGLIFDLTVAPMLFFKKTRLLAVILSAFFHLTNKLLFNIGIFPWMMLASTTLFFHPSWPRLLIWNLPPNPIPSIREYLFVDKQEDAGPDASSSPQPTVKQPDTGPFWKRPTRVVKLHRPLNSWQLLVIVVCSCFLLQQAIFPLRNLMYDGDVAWHEYGHLFSWRMKLRDKQCWGNITLQTGKQRELISPSEWITMKQFTKMKSRPDLILKFGHSIGAKYVEMGYPNVKIFADIKCQLNFRPSQQFTHPDMNLLDFKLWDWPYAFVVEQEPFPDSYLEDFPWNMPLQRIIDIITFNRHFHNNTRAELGHRDPIQSLDYFAYRQPDPKDRRQHVENRNIREHEIYGTQAYYQLQEKKSTSDSKNFKKN